MTKKREKELRKLGISDYEIKEAKEQNKKEKVLLEPIIHGGKSTTVFRSGTPATPLIVSISKALRLEHTSLDEKYKNVLEKRNYLKERLEKYENVYINSNDYSIPYVLNFSVIGVKPETMLHALEMDDIYISTQSACSTGQMSKPVFAVTNDEKRVNQVLNMLKENYVTPIGLEDVICDYAKEIMIWKVLVN